MATQKAVDAASRAVAAAQAEVDLAQGLVDRESKRGHCGTKCKALMRARLTPAQNRLSEAQRRERNMLDAFSKAEREQDRIRRQEAKEARQRDPLEQFRQVGLALGAPLLGMAAGKALLAPKIEAASQKAVAARNIQLRGVAAEAERAMAKMPAGAARSAKLGGIVQTADKLGLTRQKGPLGLWTAALLGAEAYVMRSAAVDMENETAKEITRAAGLALGFAAGGMLAQRTIERATTARVVDGKAMAAVEGARKVLQLEAAGVHVAGASAAEAARAAGPKPLEAMSIKELRVEGRKLGVKAPTALSKGQLLDAIKARTAAGASRAPAMTAAQAATASVGAATDAARRAGVKTAPAAVEAAAQGGSFWSRTLGKLSRGRLGALGAAAAVLGVGGAAGAAPLQPGRGRAFLGEAARARRRAAQAAPRGTASLGRMASSGGRRGGRVAYTRVDGETVMTTKGRAAAYRALRDKRRR